MNQRQQKYLLSKISRTKAFDARWSDEKLDLGIKDFGDYFIVRMPPFVETDKGSLNHVIGRVLSVMAPNGNIYDEEMNVIRAIVGAADADNMLADVGRIAKEYAERKNKISNQIDKDIERIKDAIILGDDYKEAIDMINNFMGESERNLNGEY